MTFTTWKDGAGHGWGNVAGAVLEVAVLPGGFLVHKDLGSCRE
ncbi:hypothetical protein NOGI109294_08520 [Nocardiopsis gilva]